MNKVNIFSNKGKQKVLVFKSKEDADRIIFGGFLRHCEESLIQLNEQLSKDGLLVYNIDDSVGSSLNLNYMTKVEDFIIDSSYAYIRNKYLNSYRCGNIEALIISFMYDWETNSFYGIPLSTIHTDKFTYTPAIVSNEKSRVLRLKYLLKASRVPAWIVLKSPEILGELSKYQLRSVADTIIHLNVVHELNLDTEEFEVNGLYFDEMILEKMNTCLQELNKFLSKSRK